MDGMSGGMALTDLTTNPSYMAIWEPAPSFTTDTLMDGGKQKEDHSHVVLPFNANQEDAIDATDAMYVYVRKD